ncbi:MAG: hypothetical protein WC325_04795 [Candidatus Bathyarchaeia archaeon]|jgi:hypothetical protein
MTYSKKLVVSFTVCSLLLMFTLTAFMPVQATMQMSGKNMPPDMPETAEQYNRTDITPQGYMETVQAMNMNVFFYKNVTLVMNCTQNCEMNVTINQQVQNRIVGVNVEPNQTMTLTMNITAVAPEGVATMERTLNFYMGLEPNAQLQLQSQLRLLINQTELNAELNREVNATQLMWMYWNQTQNQWVPVESYMNQDGYLVCNTDHFSVWTVAEVNPEDIPETIHVFTVVALAAVATVATLHWKKRKTQ